VGHSPDPWQLDVLSSRDSRLLLCCCRQSGKSTTTGVLALRLALTAPGSLILMCSPIERQSGELFATAMRFFGSLGRPLPTPKRTERAVSFGNGSRLLSLPGSGETVRGYAGVSLLVLDEGAYCRDDLLVAVSPMLAVSGGRLVGLSTPCGRRGWFSDMFHNEDNDWRQIKITADHCPRISPEFLEQERRSLGERWYNQEYMCSFESSLRQFFSSEEIERAFSTDDPPLFGARPRSGSDSILDTNEQPLFPGDSNGEPASF